MMILSALGGATLLISFAGFYVITKGWFDSKQDIKRKYNDNRADYKMEKEYHFYDEYYELIYAGIENIVKGDKNKVVTRLNQVSSITLHVPSSCECMNYLYDGLITLCNHYVNNDNADSLLLIPNIDFFNVVLYVNKCCKEKDINTDYLHAMMGIVRSFDNLKYISISFDEDGELIDSFDRLANIDSNNIDNDVVNELFNKKSLAALIFLIDCGRELEFKMNGKEYFISCNGSKNYVSLWENKNEQSFDSVLELIENATIENMCFLTAWKQSELEYLF